MTRKSFLAKVAFMVVYTTMIWRLAALYELINIDLAFKGSARQLQQQLPIVEKSTCVEERLEESKQNWERTVAARRYLEEHRPLNKEDKWSWQNGVSVWDFFYATFDCPHTVERVGNSGDGGKWICGLNHLAKKPTPCIVYSYGIADETSFEEMILERTNCSVYMFDHTIDVGKVILPAKYPGRVFVENVGLGSHNTEQLVSLETQMQKLGHKYIDILKIDVEGAEFFVMDHLKYDFPLGIPFGQISIEIHVEEFDPAGVDFYDYFKQWFENVESIGLRPFRNEINLLGMSGGPPVFAEYSFINIEGDHWLLHSE